MTAQEKFDWITAAIVQLVKADPKTRKDGSKERLMIEGLLEIRRDYCEGEPEEIYIDLPAEMEEDDYDDDEFDQGLFQL